MQQTVIIGPKSQVVIPKKVREVVPGLKAGQEVVVRPLGTRAVIVEVASNDWVTDTYGMHKKVWQGVDASVYIRKLRNEWEQKNK